MEDQVLTLRPPIEMRIFVNAAVVHARHEAGFRDKPRRYIQVFQFEREAPARTDQDRVVVLAECVAFAIEGRTYVSTIAGVPVLVQAEGAVETANPIKCSLKFAVGVHGADAGLLSEVMADSGDGKISPLSV